MWPIETARPDDREFIRDSWRKSYRESPRTCRWPTEAYAVWISAEMDRLLQRSEVRVARPGDWPEGIVGWVAAEQQPEAFVVHYAFVKPLFRRHGVLTRLVESFGPEGALVFSALRPPFSNYLKQRGFAWEPRAASFPR